MLPEHLDSLDFKGTAIDVLEAVESVGRSLGPNEVAMFHISSLEVCESQSSLLNLPLIIIRPSPNGRV